MEYVFQSHGSKQPRWPGVKPQVGMVGSNPPVDKCLFLFKDVYDIIP